MQIQRWVPVVAAFLALEGRSQSITFDLDIAYTGGVPAGDPPWLRALVAPVDANSVSLTLSAINLVGREFTTTWAFNLDPDRFTAAQDVVIASSEVLAGAIQITSSAFVPNGSGGWGNGGEVHDLEFGFRRANGEGRFTDGDMVRFILTSDLGITPDDFLFKPAGGYYSAAHVQGLSGGGEGSVKIGSAEYFRSGGEVPVPVVPEAGTTGAGLLVALVSGIGIWTRSGRRLSVLAPESAPGVVSR